MIKKFVKQILFKVLYFIDTIVAKNTDYIIFGNIGYNRNWNGNHQAFLEFLKQRNIKTYIVDEKKDFSKIIKVFKSRIVVVHHGLSDLDYPFLNLNKRIIIVLWHGINLKGLSLTDFHYYYDRQKQNVVMKNSAKYSLLISTSKIVKAVMISSFGILPEKVINTGYPRNDLLVQGSEKLPEIYLKQLERIRRIKKDKKIILYVPTFRDTVDDLYQFSQDEINVISETMKIYNCIFCFKGHPNTLIKLKTSEYIIDFSKFNISEVQIMLRETDILITDYSGIWFDFLLMKKPMIGFCYDFEKYEQERGFVYDFKKIFSGKITYDFKELMYELERLLKLKEFRIENTKYEFTKDLFHQFTDDKSSERVYEVIQKLINKEEIPKKYL